MGPEPGQDDSAVTPRMAHDSMVTVRLSEPPAMALDPMPAANPHESASLIGGELIPIEEPKIGGELMPFNTYSTPVPVPQPSALLGPLVVEEPKLEESNNNEVAPEAEESKNNDEVQHEDTPEDATPVAEAQNELNNTTAEVVAADTTGRTLQDELEDTEEREDIDQEAEESEDDASGQQTPTSERDEAVDSVQPQNADDEKAQEEEAAMTAQLLAKLEQENNRLATNPKSGKVQPEPLAPSLLQVGEAIEKPMPSPLRYSVVPPPPMTDLEFYAAVVKDYRQTAARLPTLLTNKIRKGIPPPLRGVVWQSMSGAMDRALEEEYERLSGESSPYEPIIGKDLARTFPGVDMFREPGGDGQRMLGRVLKCFSLYDPRIGYCQGLAFLVGPLLMHMPDKQAFCVLVRLMERYDLRSSFQPDLAGLHVRIYQFDELLREHLPVLARHLDDLQVDPAYVSQWFLSFFAVTCPLPMLFRIYDVIFAEGAAETLMRVALSLMRRNESRILACGELDEVMQLLLSRGLWDCYHYNADDFVQDFVSLSAIATREKLAQLDTDYRDAQAANHASANAADVTTAASRFLGRLWASSPSTSTTSTPKPSHPSPGLAAPTRPLSMLRRSASKHSLASTLNSMEASSASVVSSASTEATSLSRDSSNASPTRESVAASKFHNARTTVAEDRYLHSQIEDLLTALSELQRNQALLEQQLQRERQEREEDKQAVQSLLDGLRKKASKDSVTSSASVETVTAPPPPPPKPTGELIFLDAGLPNVGQNTIPEPVQAKKEDDSPSGEELSQLLDLVEQRFGVGSQRPRSSMLLSKSQLREDLAQTKEQLANATAQVQDYNRRIYDMDQETSALKDQLRESHAHVRNLHQDKQRLEKQIHGMRTRASAASEMSDPTSRETVSDWGARMSSTVAGAVAGAVSGAVAGTGAAAPTGAPGGGLRELKLGRSMSTPSGSAVTSKRTSSLMQRAPLGHESTIPTLTMAAFPPANEHEALLLELVQAKTAEAMAKQEAEEAKQTLEKFRRAYGLAPGEMPPTMASAAASTANAAASAAMGVLGRLTTSISESTAKTSTPAPAAAPATTAATGGGGGFWGWRR